MKTLLTASVLALALAGAVRADDALDALNNALTAYKAGNLKDAMDELAIAEQQITTQRATALAALLPPAPDGWTLTVNTDMNTGLAFAGGGVGVEGDYAKDDQSFKITIMANNAMVSSMAPMLGNAALMAQMGKITRVGKEKFVDADGQLSGLVGQQVMVQAQGAATDVMLPALQKIDFDKLEKFGS